MKGGVDLICGRGRCLMRRCRRLSRSWTPAEDAKQEASEACKRHVCCEGGWVDGRSGCGLDRDGVLLAW